MKKRFVLLTLLLLMIGLSAWADEPYTEFEYNGIVVIDGLKFAVTLPEDGKGEALLMGVDDTYSEARAATRGIIAVQNLLEAYIEFKEKQVKRVTGDAFIMPPPYGIFLRARGLSVDADNMPSLQRTATVDPDKEYTCELKVIGYSALQNNTDITELIIPETVTTIWGSAFDGCSNLQKVTLPSKLLFIGFRAFAYCNSLTEINIPNSVSEIQPGAFMNCKGLKKVSLPSGLTEISKYLFHHCENLQSVTGGENATKIGNNAFECCYKLTDYTLPSALDSICDRAFLYCQQLKSISIPRTLRGFGVEAFCGCTRLQSVVFESGSALKEINKSVFTTTSLTSVDIPNSVERIGYQAFAYSDLSNVKMPSNLIEIGDSAFHFTKLTAVTIPSSVTKICTGAFDDCGELANLTFESDSRLKTIGDNAFTAVAITELTVPDGVTTIGEAAFSACGNLESLTLSKQLTSMGDEAFMDCYALKSVTAPMASPFSIERYTFSSTTYTNATLYVPKSTKSLYQKTDSWSRFQKIVEFGDGPIADSEPYVVYNDGILTFYCDNQRSSREGTTYDLNEGNKMPNWLEHKETITKAVFDASFANARPTTTYRWFYQFVSLVEIIGIGNLNTSDVLNMGYMFAGCTLLTIIDVSGFNTENVKDMSRMFAWCNGLTSLDVRGFNTSRVTDMNGMFTCCIGLTSLDVSGFNTSNVTDLSYMFNDCSSLTSLDVSKFNTSNVSDMNHMFCRCSGLTILDVSKFNTSKVTRMDDMFSRCSSLTSIIMGSQFTSKESTYVEKAFYRCSKLSKVTFTGDIPASINSKFFDGVGTADAPATLNVPEQYKANYAAKFDGNKFYGGYFQLSSDNQDSDRIEMTFQVLNSVDGIVYSSAPCVKMTLKNISNKDFRGSVWHRVEKGLVDGDTFTGWTGSGSKTLKPGESSWDALIHERLEDGFYKCEWAYEDENDNMVSMGSTIIEVRGHDRYRAIWMDSDLNNGTMKTFCDEDNLDFSHAEGLKAYIATDFNVAASEVVVKQVSDAAAGTGLLLVGENGCYLAERTTSASNYSSNMFVGVLGDVKKIDSKEDGYTNFIYGYDGTEKFVITSDTGAYVRYNEAYLHVPTQAAGDTQTITPVFDEPTVSEEPYAVYNDYTLTFYCDDQRSSRIGTTYSLNEGEKEPDWVLDDNNRNVEKVVFDASFAKARPTSTFQWFFYCDFLTEIKGIENLNTSEVRNMRAMFFSCRRLKSIDVSHFDTKAVEDMGGMFSNCTNLESINVSYFNTSNVYNMASMFNECQSLTDLDLSNFNTGKAGYLPYIFSGCSNLRTLYLGSGFTSANDVSCEEVFADCQSLSKVVFTGDIPASINSKFFEGVGTAVAPATLVVQEQYKANYQAKFDGNMFYGGYFTILADNASALEDGDIFTAKTVEGVEMTFKVISAKDKTVQVGTGEENTSAVDKDYAGTLTIPKEINGYKVDEIASHAFSYCNFSEIVLPSGLTYIDTEAFYLCESLKSIRIPSSLQNMSVVAFVSCTSVESIVVEEGNEYFDSREGCNAIIRKDDKTLIRGCKNSFIPSGVERINFAAFQQTPLVGSFVIPEGVTYIGQSAFVSATMSSISLPSTLTYIGGLSFQNCNGIESVAIPEGVTYIGNYAFSFCDKLNRVTIPASVTEIGEKAFIGSTQLKTIVSYLTEPCAIADNVFMVNDLDDGNNSLINATLYVPFGSKTIYENTDGWKNFKNIVELNATVGDVTGDGEVTKEDITEVETEILEPSAVFDPNKDVNRDGVVNVADIVEGNNIRNSQ